MYAMTASTSQTDLTVAVRKTYTRKADAQRGAQRYARRHPEAHVLAIDTRDGAVVEQISPICPLAPETASVETTPEPVSDDLRIESVGIITGGVVQESPAEHAPVEVVDATRTPRVHTPLKTVRPFTIELFERGDEVLDIEAQPTDHPLRLRVVIVDGSVDVPDGGEVVGLIEWRTGVNRWVPALAARDEDGTLTDHPRPDWTGKPVSGKARAVTALFDLLARRYDQDPAVR